MPRALSGESTLASVDYFNGRRVDDVAVPKDAGKEGSPYWTIFFEGGAKLHNYDERTPTPKAIKGAALTRCIFDGTNKVTRLQFGLEEVILNPVMYAIEDEGYTKGQLVYPQRSQANMVLGTPDDPSSVRIHDGRTHDEDDDGA